MLDDQTTTKPAAHGQPYDFHRQMDTLPVPTALFSIRGLSPGACLLWAAIRLLSQRNGRCWASNEYLAGKLQVSEAQVRRYVRQLKTAGLLDVLDRPGSTPLRTLLFHRAFDGTVAEGRSDVTRGVVTSDQGGWSQMTTKNLSLGFENQDGIETRQSESPREVPVENSSEPRQAGMRPAAEILRNEVAKKLPAAHGKKLIVAASMSERQSVRETVEGWGYEYTPSLEAKLFRKAAYYGKTGYQLAAVLQRSLKKVSSKPSLQPTGEAWFTTVVENEWAEAFRRRAASHARP